jgi:cation/acetate symporter
VRDARKSAGWALLFIAILYTTAPAIAAFARTNLISTVSNQPYAEMPEWFDKWEETGLIVYDDINKDGIVQYVGDAAQNELTIDRDIMVLANPEIANLPNWVIALVAAGGLAAALSTAAGLLLVISTSIAHDLIKKQIAPQISEKKELAWARGGAVFAVLVAGYFGINPPDFVAATVALAFGLAAASFFPAIILGIFDKRMNREGAISGMVIGISLMIFYIAIYKMGWFIEEVPSSDKWWFGISPEGFGTIAMIVNMIVSLVVSRLTPEPPVEVQEIVENIRVPRGAGAALEH